MSLLIATTVLAVVSVTVGNWGVLGLLAIFGPAVLLSFASWFDFEDVVRGRRAIYDLVWGELLAILCLLFDPVLFQPQNPPAMSVQELMGCNFRLDSFALLGYTAIGFQLLVMLAWLFLGHAMPRLTGVAAGCLTSGGLIALAIGLRLSPLSVLGTMYLGIGLLGFTPFFTAWAYFRRAIETGRHAHATLAPGWFAVSFTLGIAMSAVLPLVVVLIAFGPDGVFEAVTRFYKLVPPRF